VYHGLRWKTFSAKIDPAQLRATYIEYLLPRLEIGLLYAGITQEMCNAWMSSIIYTFCDRSGMVSKHSLNRSLLPLGWDSRSVDANTDYASNRTHLHVEFEKLGRWCLDSVQILCPLEGSKSLRSDENPRIKDKFS